MINTILNKMIAYNAGDAKRINHAIKVFTFAQNIALNEQCSDNLFFIISAAAILLKNETINTIKQNIIKTESGLDLLN